MAKLTLKEKLKKQKADIAASGKGGGNVLYLKEGTTRIRILPIEQEELAAEVTHFYLNEKLKGIYSASTNGEPCFAMETYQELKKSKDDEDLDLAKKLSPKKAWLLPVVLYEDDKGKKIDTEKSGKLLKVPNGVYNSIIDLWLDEDEWGDMTDPKKGYDIKIIRTGKGKNDTEYSVVACKNTPLDKEWAKKKIDLDKMVSSLIEPYDTVKSKIEEFLGVDSDDDVDNKKHKKSKDKKKGKKDGGSSSNDFSASKKSKLKEKESSKDKKSLKKKKSKK